MNAILVMKLIDTDILIDFSHEVPVSEHFLEALSNVGEELCISAITRMELIQGCMNRNELITLSKFLQNFTLIHISETISQKAIELMERYNLSHGLLIPDAIIAATAIITELELYSRNVKHFQMIKGLEVFKPY